MAAMVKWQIFAKFVTNEVWDSQTLSVRLKAISVGRYFVNPTPYVATFINHFSVFFAQMAAIV